jgi:hypothetical protein
MEKKIWHEMQEARFKSEYSHLLSKLAHTLSNLYSFLLAFSSAGFIAAWTVWETVPYVWGAIVASSQLLHLAKPSIPFIKQERELFEIGSKYNQLFIMYEKLYSEFNRGKLTEDQTHKQYFALRSRESNFISSYKRVKIPKFNKLITQASSNVQYEFKRKYY